jgi:uncharacterized protein (TIGR02145 family)
MKKGIEFFILLSLLTSVITINSCKKDPVIPTLTTANATNVTVNSLTSGGNITSNGGAEVTARGVCYGTSANPDISGSHTSDSNVSGNFVSNVAGLIPNTLYHIRAYATNSAGTAYGNEVLGTTIAIILPSLTTAVVTSIALTTAASGGTITSDGNDAVTARGVCWATSTSPTLTNSKTTDGTGTGTFTSNLTGLDPSTIYYVRAYATNSVGTAYGNEISFTTSAGAVPTLTTAAISSITSTSAVSGGNITADGGTSVTARGICWAIASGPTIANFKTINGTGTGAFTSNITGLASGTTYYVRAYATNNAGTAYGNELSFTATSIQLPSLTTSAITLITATSAVSGGNVTADGGAAVNAKGVCWSTATSPTIAGSKTNDGTGTGTFTSNITGLANGTTYYVRAYATNSKGTSYGNELSFVAATASIPTIATTSVTSISLTSAVSGGNITSDGGGTVTSSGICWSTTTNPTIIDSRTTDGTATGSFVSNLTGLVSGGTTYYVRAYATNSAGTGYGNQLTFNTNVADVDGNSYKTVTIGTQVWMAENLKTTKYNDGTAIPNVTDNTTWSTLTTGAYSDYSNTPTYSNTYGRLYNWYVVASTNTKKVCPTGWHVPTDAQFTTLTTYLGGESLAGGKLKETGTTHWLSPNLNATNETGFTALPGGYRAASGSFGLMGNTGFLWTSTISGTTYAYFRYMYYNSGSLKGGDDDQHTGYYVRCLKD